MSKNRFVFQAYNLLPKLTAIENVEMPAMYNGDSKKLEIESKKTIRNGWSWRQNASLSKWNEWWAKQRVAIARSLINEPKIILADEPTGNLDSVSSEEILQIFRKLNDQGVTILMVTHEEDVANHTKKNS